MQPSTFAYRTAAFREPSISFYVHLHFMPKLNNELRLSHKISGW